MACNAATLFDLISEVGNDNASDEYYLTDVVALARARGLTTTAVACDERRNALDAVELYRQAPWLDYPMRIDGFYSPAADMIAEKIRPIEQWMER